MKLNNKRTVLVGFTFFLICAFWQIYDVTIAMTLTNKFGMNQDISGIVLALDNILALFMLPLFGGISDRCKSKAGRRTPFIRVGTVLAVIFLVLLSFADNAQLKNIGDYTKVNDPATMERIYDAQKDTLLKTPEGVEYTLAEVYPDRAEFAALTTESKTTEINQFGLEVEVNLYTRYVVPARQACAHDATNQNPTTLIVYIGILLLLLISMAIFRTPAVALMPDVTVKPLRSKANAIINLMGNAGGIIVLVLGTVLAISKVKNAYMSYIGVYSIVGGIMLLALLIFLFTVKEPKWAAQMQEESAALGLEEGEETRTSQKKGLEKGKRRSLIFLLASVIFWYAGYNAITSKYTVYAQSVLDKDATLTLLLANAAAIVTYIPVGMIASKIGRKKTILAGVVMLFTAFFVACFLTATSSAWLMTIMFILAGVGWATINVNSFPMVVEMCSGADVGKYTGLYYTASMASQALTPYFSGLLMKRIAWTTLFPYASVAVALAFVTMLLVKHGDSKVEAKRGLEAFDNDDE